MVAAFSFLTAAHIRFGRGVASEATGAIAALGRRALVVHGRNASRADWLLSGLRGAGLDVSPVSCTGEPDLGLLTAALEAARDFGPDVVVGIGGGAALDLGKALAALVPATGDPLDHLEVVGKGLPLAAPPLPFVAIPTTAGTGAEVTKNAVIGVPQHRRKVSLRDDRMLARLALVDPALTDDTPGAVTLGCGLDALTQVIEPFLCTRANPMTDALCRDAIPRGLSALCRLMDDPHDSDARDDMALVSLFGGLALANSGLGVVHGLAGVLGGLSPVPHGVACGALLPHALRVNRRHLPSGSEGGSRTDAVLGWIAETLGPGEEALEKWGAAQGLPGLATFGIDAADVDTVAAEAQRSSSMKANPAVLPVEAVAEILRAAL